MKISSFLNWDSAPAVLGANDAGQTVGFAFNPDSGVWFNVSPADLSANGRVMSADHFAAVFPDADLTLLDRKPGRKFTDWGNRPAVIDEAGTHAFAVLSYGGDWVPVDAADVFNSGTVLSDDAFKRRFGELPQLPIMPLDAELKTTPSSGLFSGISDSRLNGIIEQGLALAKMDLESRQPGKKPQVILTPAPPMPNGSITLTKAELEEFSKPALPLPVVFLVKD